MNTFSAGFHSHTKLLKKMLVLIFWICGYKLVRKFIIC